MLVDDYPKTNNRAELNAAILALEQACSEGIKFLRIHTDSEYVFRIATQWIKMWKQNDWKKSDGTSLSNLQDIKLLDQLSQKINTKWILVRGYNFLKTCTFLII
jgi:ribonuclease HI